MIAAASADFSFLPSVFFFSQKEMLSLSSPIAALRTSLLIF
jgi:hypothetical protein